MEPAEKKIFSEKKQFRDMKNKQEIQKKLPIFIFLKDKFSSNWWKLIQITYCNNAKSCK